MLKNERLVLAHLDPTAYRRTIEIMRLIEDDGARLSLGGCWAALDRFQDDGIVEVREAQLTPTELANRGGRGAREFRLTDAGVRRQAEAAHRRGRGPD